MITLLIRHRPLLITTTIILMLAAGVEAGGFAYKPATRESDKLHLTTDLAAYWRLSGDNRHPDATYLDNEVRLMLSLDIGLYKNLDDKQGFGAGLFAASTSESNRVGIRARYRRWLSKYGRLDISPGIVIAGRYEGSGFVFPGFSGTLSYSPIRWVSIVAAAEVLRHEATDFSYGLSPDEKWTSTTLYGGLRLESYAGLIGTGVLAVGVVLLVVAIASAYND